MSPLFSQLTCTKETVSLLIFAGLHHNGVSEKALTDNWCSLLARLSFYFRFVTNPGGNRLSRKLFLPANDFCVDHQFQTTLTVL